MEPSSLNTIKDEDTGLLIRNSLTALSGFNYQTGIRSFGNLKIVEGVAKGTACILLTSIMVFDQDGSLIFDGEIRKRTHYTRETARQMILHGLLAMLKEATDQDGRSFDYDIAYDLIDRKLKTAYYEKSYASVVEWARSLGILLQ